MTRVLIQHKYKPYVDKVCRDCATGRTVFKEVAPTLDPVVAVLSYMRLFGIRSLDDLSVRLNHSQASVSRVLNGLQTPGMPLRKAFEALCFVPADSWDRPKRTA